jgi:hypothetical protein
MYIKESCPTCRGSAKLHFSETSDIDCPSCADGFFRKEIESAELVTIMDDLDKVKKRLKKIMDNLGISD